MVVPGRRCSSLARMVSPFTSLTSITARANRPSSPALAAGFAYRVDAAENDVVDQSRIEDVAVLQRRKCLAREIECRHLVQRAVGLAAPTRGPHVVVYEGIGHFVLRKLFVSRIVIGMLK